MKLSKRTLNLTPSEPGKKTGAGSRSFLARVGKYGKPGDSYAWKMEAFLCAGGLSLMDIDRLRNLLLEKR